MNKKKREKKEITKHFSSVLGQIPPFCSNTALTQALHSPPSIALCIVPLIICLLASWLQQYVATFCFQFECLISLRVDELNCCSGRWGCCLIYVFLGNETPCRNVLFHNCYNKCTGWNCSEIGKYYFVLLFGTHFVKESVYHRDFCLNSLVGGNCDAQITKKTH